MEKFKQMILAQGVSQEVCSALCEKPENVLPLSKHATTLYAPKTGLISHVDPLACAEVSAMLGAGRSKPTDKVTHNTGLRLMKSVGDFVEKNQPWVSIYHVEDSLKPVLKTKLEEAIKIDETKQSETGSRSKIYSIVTHGPQKPVMACQ